MKKALVFLLLYCFCLSLVSCSLPETTADASTIAEPNGDLPDEDALQPTVELKPQVYDLSQNETLKLVKRLGRSTVTRMGITLDYTASGVEFEAYIGEEFSFDIVNVVNPSDKQCPEVYFTVFVDGKRLEERFSVQGTRGTVRVMGLDPDVSRTKTVRIIKQTEHFRAYCELSKLSFFGKLVEPAADRDLYIEFIGDSITAGYGNLIHGDPIDGSNAGDAIHSDGTQAYAFLAAEKLGADTSIISHSGIGLQKGFVPVVVRDFYQSSSYYRNNGLTKFDFSKARRPDIVVINIGTNDQSFLSQGVGSREAFDLGVRELVALIRTAYGEETPILWVYGMMGSACSDVTLRVLEELGGEENHLYTLGVPSNTFGGHGHPELSAHTVYADTLADTVKQILDP